MSKSAKITGKVWGVFAHRFAIESQDEKVLADLGPEGRKRVTLSEGDRVTVEGERKPSEIKVATIVCADGSRHKIDWPPKPEHGKHHHDHHHPDADPQIALRAVHAEGYAVEGEPKRKPKHWEIQARRGGHAYELHVELDGHVRKAKDLSLLS